jgi:hypothetical protein
MMKTADATIENRTRSTFGKSGRRFLSSLDEERVW